MKNKNKRMWYFKKHFLVLIFSFFVSYLYPQGIKITGVVKDSKTGEPIPAANIVVEGSMVGTSTDADGKFSLNVNSPQSVLIVSYVGYKSLRIPLNGRTQIDVFLEEESKELEEIVVIGYQTVKRRDVTGSVVSVSGDKIKEIPINSAVEAMTGKLAGVQIVTTEGSPDAEVKIRVRGGGSITRDNSPLYIVDGFPVNNISDIPPTEIQSIDVLKDASATAIYGSRGANGVVIITTKSAKEGKISVNYNGYYGQKYVPRFLSVLSPYEFALWQYEQATLQNAISTQYEKYFGNYEDIDLYKYMKGTNWQDVVFGNTGTTSNHSLTINGGSEQISFNASYSRVDDKAIMLGSKFNRDNLNLKLSAKPTKLFKLNFSLRYSNTEIYGSGANDVTGTEKSTADSRLKHSVIYTPISLKNWEAPDDEEESFGSLYPPTTSIKDNDRQRSRKIFNFNSDASVNITKWLTFRTELGFNYSRSNDNRFFGLSTYYVTGGDASIKNKPAVQLTNIDDNSFRNANILTLNKTILNDHNIVLLLGEETSVNKKVTLTSWIDGLPEFFTSEKAWAFTTQGVANNVNNYYFPEDKMISFFGRFNYDYKGKYLLTTTFRADGSSKFAPGNRWGYFPSFAFAWRISEESFMGNITWLNNLKLRLSYGTAGNNNIPSMAYMQTYSSYSTTYLPSSLATSYWAASSIMVNEKLKWETAITRNVALDFGMFKNRINGTIEVYQNDTKDLLIDFPVTGSGYNTQLRNIGRTSNKGIELTLNSNVVNQKDLKVDFSFNISANNNKVEDLGGVPQIIANSGWTSDAQASNDYIVLEGEPVGLMYGYVTEGFYSVDEFDWVGDKWVLKNPSSESPDNSGFVGGNFWGPGALKLKDLNKDGKITESDRTIIGNANPDFFGGFGLNIAYKNIDLSANFTYSYGNDVYNANKIEFTTCNKYAYRNMLDIMSSDKRWVNIDVNTGQRITDPETLREINKNATIWSPGIGRYIFHSWAVEDGSFLRLQNLTIGYTLSQNIIKKLYLKNLRVYFSGYNLFLLTKYSGYDPEVDTRRKTPLTPGVDYSAYPRSRSFNFGINVTL